MHTARQSRVGLSSAHAAGLHFRRHGLKEILELPLYASMPWHDDALQVKPNVMAEGRKTSGNFNFGLAVWDRFAENTVKYWKVLPPFDEELQAEFRNRPVAYHSWATVHLSNGDSLYAPWLCQIFVVPDFLLIFGPLPHYVCFHVSTVVIDNTESLQMLTYVYLGKIIECIIHRVCVSGLDACMILD
jgi:hypothetical protein